MVISTNSRIFAEFKNGIIYTKGLSSYFLLRKSDLRSFYIGNLYLYSGAVSYSLFDNRNDWWGNRISKILFVSNYNILTFQNKDDYLFINWLRKQGERNFVITFLLSSSLKASSGGVVDFNTGFWCSWNTNTINFKEFYLKNGTYTTISGGKNFSWKITEYDVVDFQYLETDYSSNRSYCVLVNDKVINYSSAVKNIDLGVFTIKSDGEKIENVDAKKFSLNSIKFRTNFIGVRRNDGSFNAFSFYIDKEDNFSCHNILILKESNGFSVSDLMTFDLDEGIELNASDKFFKGFSLTIDGYDYLVLLFNTAKGIKIVAYRINYSALVLLKVFDKDVEGLRFKGFMFIDNSRRKAIALVNTKDVYEKDFLALIGFNGNGIEFYKTIVTNIADVYYDIIFDRDFNCYGLAKIDDRLMRIDFLPYGVYYDNGFVIIEQEDDIPDPVPNFPFDVRYRAYNYNVNLGLVSGKRVVSLEGSSAEFKEGGTVKEITFPDSGIVDFIVTLKGG